MAPLPAPAWLDRDAYPFEGRRIPFEAGRMHVVDEGDGPAVVMLHGNPTWSFMYRRLIAALSPRFRCVAPDFLGFGLSDAPSDGSYAPEARAARLEQLLDRLDVRDLTLVVHDWGGPIGLSYALRHPERIRRLVVLNTWLWPRAHDPLYALFSRTVGSAPGRFLVERFNVLARFGLYAGYGHPRRLSSEIRRHYSAPADTPARRAGHWRFARALTEASSWLQTLWDRRERLAGTPVLLVWGGRDPVFRSDALDRWRGLFPRARVHRLADVGHFVAEEAGERLPPLVERFLSETT